MDVLLYMTKETFVMCLNWGYRDRVINLDYLSGPNVITLVGRTRLWEGNLCAHITIATTQWSLDLNPSLNIFIIIIIGNKYNLYTFLLALDLSLKFTGHYQCFWTFLSILSYTGLSSQYDFKSNTQIWLSECMICVIPHHHILEWRLVSFYG